MLKKKICFKKLNKNFLEDQGQAIFEFFLFLPLMLSIYVITVFIGNAINGSINQQKVTRAYLYFLMLGDSEYPTYEILKDSTQDGASQIGMFALGWKTRFEGKTPVAPCYKMLSLSTEVDPNLQSNLGDPIRQCAPGDNTRPLAYIRVKTSYGVCVGTFVKSDNGGFNRINNSPASGSRGANWASCTNQKG
ncbi:MAG: hypothetical protein HQK51_10305 [Oligoflexia bacterium]|nr:hypothetical protein [Oligoflexia bacterium]